ncbi:MAG TPA: FecR family protein [Verrucomicrobiae bacterium]|jgi:hypothetical protein|nr:FecR family protein [Verrucomicrobiae bacterium]
MSRRPLSPFSISLALASLIILMLPAFADSHARIVRLSDVQGTVQIDKNSSVGFERAFLNFPITQGTQLRTGTDGRAEVEFEDGSTVLLAPNTTVQFNALSLNNAGSRLSGVELTGGTAYVNWLGKSGDVFNLNFSRERLSLGQFAHFRVNSSAKAAELAVFKGELSVEGPAGTVALGKHKTARFDVQNDDTAKVENRVPKEALDSWDNDSNSYHSEYARNATASPYGYGLSDLNYYGSFMGVPGYGMMWQPFFAGVGWDPFMDGAWGFYPGYGYMFASAYPWGWLPYHYGNWMFVNPYGWMWQPGGWNAWQAVPHYTPTASAHITALTPPATTTGNKTVLVGNTVPAIVSPERISINARSAGMGIPRGAIDDLHSLNGQVAKRGFVEMNPSPRMSPGGDVFRGNAEPAHNGMPASMSSHSSSAGHASGGAGSPK